MSVLAAAILAWGASSELPGQAPPSSEEATELAKKTQNPVSDLATVPLQFNFFSGGALKDRTESVVNLQPVFPFKVGSMNLITRTVVPFIDIPGPGPTERVTGVGDIIEEIFFTSADPGATVIGIGPILSFPTATNDFARTGDWAAGPAIVVVHISGSFVLGALATQLWTYSADDTGPHLNQMTVQPFVNYNLSEGWAVSFSPAVTANWNLPSGEKWTVPLGLGVSKVTTLVRQPITLGLQYYNNVVRPSNAGSSLIRFAVSFLFPHPPGPK